MPDSSWRNIHSLFVLWGGGFSLHFTDSQNSTSVTPLGNDWFFSSHLYAISLFCVFICIQLVSFPFSVFFICMQLVSFPFHCITSTLWRKKLDTMHTQDALFHGKSRTRARGHTIAIFPRGQCLQAQALSRTEKKACSNWDLLLTSPCPWTLEDGVQICSGSLWIFIYSSLPSWTGHFGSDIPLLWWQLRKCAG